MQTIRTLNFKAIGRNPEYENLQIDTDAQTLRTPGRPDTTGDTDAQTLRPPGPPDTVKDKDAQV